MKIKIKNGKWQTGNLYDCIIAAKFDEFINLHREPKKQALRSKITKEHNHKFKKNVCI